MWQIWQKLIRVVDPATDLRLPRAKIQIKTTLEPLAQSVVVARNSTQRAIVGRDEVVRALFLR